MATAQFFQSSVTADSDKVNPVRKLQVKGNYISTCAPLLGSDDWVTSSYDTVPRKPGEMPVIFPAEHRVSFVELHRAANKQGPPTERWLATGPIAVSKQLKKIAFKNADKDITIISVDATEPGSASTQTISKTYIEEQLNDSLPSEMGEYIGF